jgi:hypothetical protein
MDDRIFALLAGLGLCGLAMNMAGPQPYDWKDGPRQRYVASSGPGTGNADLSINYQPQTAKFAPMANLKSTGGTDHYRRKGLALNATDSRDGVVRNIALRDVVLNNKRWGSGVLGSVATTGPFEAVH